MGRPKTAFLLLAIVAGALLLRFTHLDDWGLWVDEIFTVQHAGELFKGEVAQGECLQVATGSPIPRGSDAVVMVEFTKLDGEIVDIEKHAHPGANIAPSG